MDPRRIKNKAIQAGIRAPEELARATEKELLGLILLPGFSTAKEVTDVSGRGVGMDVVKTNLDRLGGTLEIDSTPGAGTAFSLCVPLTLAIIPCLIVGSGGQRYAIPQKDLVELVCLHPELTATKIEATVDRELVRLRDRLLPLARLSEVFAQSCPFDAARRREIASKYHPAEMLATVGSGSDLPQAEKLSSPEFALFAVVKAGSRRYGIVVDEILNSEEIVVKPMHGSLKPLACFSGATIMGDGRVALILNIEGIAQHAGIRWGEFTCGANGRCRTYLCGRGRPALVRVRSARAICRAAGDDPADCNDRSRTNRAHRPPRFHRYRRRSHSDYAARPIPAGFVGSGGKQVVFAPSQKLGPTLGGCLATSIIDTETLPANFSSDAFRADGVMGTAMVRGRMTLFLDMARLADLTDDIPQIPPARPAPTASKSRILVVEDTQFFRELIGGHLRNAGYEVATACNGVEALRLLETENFDLVVSDIEMPLMDGWAFAQSVRRNSSWKDMPLLALTTLNSSESRNRAKQCGFDGYLVKLDRDELLTEAAEMLLLREHSKATSAAGGNS